MMDILAASNPLKVGKSIIGLDAVSMVDFVVFRSRSLEDLHEETMDRHVLPYTVPRQMNA